MDMSACIEACLNTHRLCSETAAHVLHGQSKEGHKETEHLVALLDCAQISIASVDFMARRSPHHAHICAEVCRDMRGLCQAVRGTSGPGRSDEALRRSMPAERQDLPRNG